MAANERELSNLFGKSVSIVVYAHFLTRYEIYPTQGVHTCSSVRLVHLVWTKKENYVFGPDRLSIHTGISDGEPKDTEPKGVVIRSQPDWSR